MKTFDCGGRNATSAASFALHFLWDTWNHAMAFEPTLIYYYIKDLSRLIQCNCERQDIIRGGSCRCVLFVYNGWGRTISTLVLDFLWLKIEKNVKKIPRRFIAQTSRRSVKITVFHQQSQRQEYTHLTTRNAVLKVRWMLIYVYIYSLSMLIPDFLKTQGKSRTCRPNSFLRQMGSN